MIGFYVCLGVERTQRYTYNRPRVRIGSAGDNELVLRDGDVPEHACTVELRDGACFVNDAPKPDGAELEIGDYVLVLALTERPWKRLEVTDDVERRLIDSILAHDEDSRLVYADWLEERGQARRAEFLRIQDALVELPAGDPARDGLVQRLRVLATLIDVGWRRRIGRPPIVGCEQPACPRWWSDLDEGSDPNIRRCERCDRGVFYCTSLDDMHRHVSRGHRAVVDATVRR